MKIGHYYWVRLKAGVNREWQPGMYQEWNNQPWIALFYDKAHFGLRNFDVGDEIVHRLSRGATDMDAPTELRQFFRDRRRGI
jgi:hypothetical protein